MTSMAQRDPDMEEVVWEYDSGQQDRYILQVLAHQPVLSELHTPQAQTTVLKAKRQYWSCMNNL